jgi:hypothetical protein
MNTMSETFAVYHQPLVHTLATKHTLGSPVVLQMTSPVVELAADSFDEQLGFAHERGYLRI